MRDEKRKVIRVPLRLKEQRPPRMADIGATDEEILDALNESVLDSDAILERLDELTFLIGRVAELAEEISKGFYELLGSDHNAKMSNSGYFEEVFSLYQKHVTEGQRA